jgi:hypothetical protein
VRKTIFHEDWWLDIVAPGRWAEVTAEHGYLRYAHSSRLMFRSIKMPPLTRTLGPVLKVEGKKAETRQRAMFTTVCDLLDQLSGYDLIRFRLDPSLTDVVPFQARGYQTSLQHTLLVDCRAPVDDLWAGMRDKTRNIVRRAQDSLSVVEIDDAERFVRFYIDNLEGNKSYFDLGLVPRIHQAALARGQARIVAAVDRRGTVHAQTFFIWDDHSYYYFLSSRNETVAHAGAVSQLLWIGMQHAHRLGLTFDFDGITSEARYQFLVGFGGQSATRFIVSKGLFLYEMQAGARKLADRLVGAKAATF